MYFIFLTGPPILEQSRNKYLNEIDKYLNEPDIITTPPFSNDEKNMIRAQVEKQVERNNRSPEIENKIVPEMIYELSKPVDISDPDTRKKIIQKLHEINNL